MGRGRPGHRGLPIPRAPVRAPARCADPTSSGSSASTSCPPRGDLGDAEFVRADIRNPVIAKVIAADERRHRRAHERASPPRGSAGGRDVDEGDQRHRHDAAARRLPEGAERAQAGGEVDRPRSTAPRRRDPAMFTEDMEPQRAAALRLRQGRRSRSRATCAASPGAAPTSTSPCCGSPTSSARRSTPPLTRYFALPVVPTVLGFDPRLQFVHEDDALEVLRHADRRATAAAPSTSPATACCCCPRRSAAPAGRRCRCRAALVGVGRRLVRAGSARRLLARADARS